MEQIRKKKKKKKKKKKTKKKKKKKKKIQKLNCSNFNLGDKMCFFSSYYNYNTQAFQNSYQCNKFYEQLYDFRITTAITQKI